MLFEGSVTQFACKYGGSTATTPRMHIILPYQIISFIFFKEYLVFLCSFWDIINILNLAKEQFYSKLLIKLMINVFLKNTSVIVKLSI